MWFGEEVDCALEGKEHWSQRKVRESGVHKDIYDENTSKAIVWENVRSSFL